MKHYILMRIKMIFTRKGLVCYAGNGWFYIFTLLFIN